MWLYFYVEEQSAEAALIELVPRILEGYEFEFDIFYFQGKQDLLRKLPDRLKAYQHQASEDWCIVVLVDRDAGDCSELKRRLEQFAFQANLPTRTRSPEQYKLINRIAIEELEAWFFGDVEALSSAYPKVDSNIAQKSEYRDPDAIKGGTWERLGRLLESYHPGGLEKTRAASDIAQYMNPDINRSKSFQVFRDALRSIFEDKKQS